MTSTPSGKYPRKPGSPIKVPSDQLVKQSYDHDATGHTNQAILDMLRALYQQNEEHYHKISFYQGPTSVPSPSPVIAHPTFGLPEGMPNYVNDQRPHSRACGIANHPHGDACSNNCPTCGGVEL